MNILNSSLVMYKYRQMTLALKPLFVKVKLVIIFNNFTLNVKDNEN